MQLISEEIVKKWEDILDHPNLPSISDPYKRKVTAQLLETAEREYTVAAAHGAHQLLTEDPIPQNNVQGGNIDNFDPVLISLVRRFAPNLIAFDICGVQPMTGPVGLVFAMRPQYANTSNGAIGEVWYDEVNTTWSTVASGANTFGNKHVGTMPGNTSQTANLAEEGLYNTGRGMSTAQAEALGTDGNTAWPQMTFTIDRHSVTAVSRKLKAEYTLEVAQDLKAIHGLEIESELSNILSTEILSEINREVVRTINFSAKVGSQESVTTAGIFDLDTDSNGRWLVEKYKGLMMHVETEANRIAKETRRGKGNFILCSSDVASALDMAGKLDYAPKIQDNNLSVDDTGVTFVGVLNGKFKVYIDPYADGMPSNPGLNYMTVGYKGATQYEAGLFYCPYVPLQMVRAVDPGAFQPKIGFHTRYGITANPYAQGKGASNQGDVLKDSNVFFRRSLITHLK